MGRRAQPGKPACSLTTDDAPCPLDAVRAQDPKGRQAANEPWLARNRGFGLSATSRKANGAEKAETQVTTSNDSNGSVLKVNCGKGLVLDVDVSRFSDEVYDHCFRLGLKTALRNVHAGVEDHAESNKLSQGKLESFYSGQVHRPGGGGFSQQLADKDAEIAALKAALAEAAGKPPSSPTASKGVVRRPGKAK